MTASQPRFSRAMRLRFPIISTLKKYWTASLRHTEIAALELEFHKVASNPYNAARASEILSSLAKLYQTELAERKGTACAEAAAVPPEAANPVEAEPGESQGTGDGSSPLVRQCQSIIGEAKQRMSQARCELEVRVAFRKGVLELMDTLRKNDDASI
jgi:hypothetical protein